MIISDYERMEKIVKNNPALSWNGWDVVMDKKTPNGFTHFNGVYKDNSWHIRKTFRLTESGWNLPDKLVIEDVQVV